jgi:predicted dehydrogenase
VRLAIVGLGSACLRAHLPAIARLEREGAAILCAGADPDPDRRAILAELLPHLPTFTSVEELLASISPDVLVVAAEPRSHPRLVATGIEHGAHVLCEKPLAVTQAGHALVARGCMRRPDLAVVPVHQYRYSPQWSPIMRWARRAARLRLPYSLTVDVQRNGTDPSAVSGWRAEEASGGMLADAGVHFLALASTIGQPLTALQGVRKCDGADRERTIATARLGSGTLRIRVWRGAPKRHTRIELRGGGMALIWSDQTARVSLGRLSLPGKQVDALSDRDHVDALYASLYRDLATWLPDHSWRTQRTKEALAVAKTLVTLLEQMPVNAGVIA